MSRGQCIKRDFTLTITFFHLYRAVIEFFLNISLFKYAGYAGAMPEHSSMFVVNLYTLNQQSDYNIMI